MDKWPNSPAGQAKDSTAKTVLVTLAAALGATLGFLNFLPTIGVTSQSIRNSLLIVAGVMAVAFAVVAVVSAHHNKEIRNQVLTIVLVVILSLGLVSLASWLNPALFPEVHRTTASADNTAPSPQQDKLPRAIASPPPAAPSDPSPPRVAGQREEVSFYANKEGDICGEGGWRIFDAGQDKDGASTWVFQKGNGPSSDRIRIGGSIELRKGCTVELRERSFRDNRFDFVQILQ